MLHAIVCNSIHTSRKGKFVKQTKHALRAIDVAKVILIACILRTISRFTIALNTDATRATSVDHILRASTCTQVVCVPTISHTSDIDILGGHVLHQMLYSLVHVIVDGVGQFVDPCRVASDQLSLCFASCNLPTQFYL